MRIVTDVSYETSADIELDHDEKLYVKYGYGKAKMYVTVTAEGQIGIMDQEGKNVAYWARDLLDTPAPA